MRWSDVHERRKEIRNISWPQYQDSGAPVGLGDHVTASEFVFDSRGETEIEHVGVAVCIRTEEYFNGWSQWLIVRENDGDSYLCDVETVNHADNEGE